MSAKAIKRELKEWEHTFVSTHGRKPDKKDISADRVIAKKYKTYAKLKSEGIEDPVVEESDLKKGAAMRSSEITLRNSRVTVPVGGEKKSRTHHKSSSRAAEDHSGSGEAIDDGFENESFKTSSPVKVEPQGIFSTCVQPQQQQQQQMNESFGGEEMDEEDRAAMDFFTQNYESPTTGKFSISKEELYASTSIDSIGANQNRTSAFAAPEYNSRPSTSSSGNVLPNNFKMRKSTIAAGPIATDEHVHSEAQQLRRVQRESLYRDDLEDQSSYTLRTFTPPPPTTQPTITSLATSSSNINPDLQDFLHRRQQLQSPASPPPPQIQPQRSYTPQPRAPSVLGSYTPVGPPVITRVITPTTQVQQVSVASPQEAPHPVFVKKSAKPVLDLFVPAPPAQVQLDDIGSEEDGEEEDYAAAVLSARAVKKAVGVVVAGKQRARKGEKVGDNGRDNLKVKKVGGFFPVEEAQVDEVVPFDAVETEVEEKDESEKSEAKVEAAVVSAEEVKGGEVKGEEVKEEKIVEVSKADEIAVVIASPTEVVAVAAPTFVVNPKMFSRIQPDFLLKCRVQRKKNLLDKTHPTFYLYNEVDNTFLLAARKRKKSAMVNYLISTSQDDLSKDSTHYIAKMKGNFQRTNFILLDARFYNKTTAGKGLKEMSCVSYSKTVLPRELSVAIAATSVEENSESGTKDIMADIKSQNLSKLLFLKNKPPRWNETTQSHCLNFGGRVTQPSIKNFQLVMEGSDAIILQFGRCGPDVFSLDARWPLTPIEAFAIAISTFDAYDSA
ncbi:Tubby- protein 3 [Podochytrium sp. JEL0797]|nr:Tubby- protein 3 [Podochytrium sp. JEL0797]